MKGLLKYIFYIAVVFGVVILLTAYKIDHTLVNYEFFPKQVLIDMYQSDFVTPEKTKKYSDNISEYNILGKIKDGRGEYIRTFSEYAPDIQNKDMSLVWDYGTMRFYNEERYKESGPLDFQMCLGQYNRVDTFSKDISVLSDLDTKGFTMGYVTAVYISPTGIIKIYDTPLDEAGAVFSSRDDNFFLKEFCVFIAYEPDPGMPETNYTVRKDGEVISKYSINHSAS